MARPDRINVAGGLVVAAFGALALYIALGYRFGSLREMGPGFFPVVLSVAIIGLGLAAALGGGRADERPAPAWRPLAAVLGSIAAFAFLMRHTGLMPATFAAVCVAALGDRTARPLAILAVAVLLPVVLWLLFTVALGLPIPVLRSPW